MGDYQAPDGGWGWVVVFACFSVRIFIYGMTSTSGVIYMVLLDEFEAGEAKTAIVGSLITASGFFIGTFAGGLTNKLGCRPVVMLAGFTASAGLIISMFAISVDYLIITYGVVTGVGLGLCFVPCSVLVSQYFDKKRNLALGLAAGGGGVGSFLFPILLRQFIGAFGWRGTLLICGGLSLNICVCGALMRPPHGNCSSGCRRKADEESETGETVNNEQGVTGSLELRLTDFKKDGEDVQEKQNETVEPLLVNKADSETGEVMDAKSSDSDKFAKKARFFYWDIFKDPKFIVLAVNNFFFSFASSIVYIHMMAFLKDVLNIQEDRSALLLTAMGVTILVSKIGTGFIATHPKVDEHVIYISCITLTGLVTIAIPFAKHFAIWVVYACVFGFGYATLGGCLLPTLCVKYLGVKRLPSSYGALLLCEGVGHFIGAPCAGWLYQVTGVYANSFFLSGTVSLVAGLMMIPSWKCFKQSSPVVEEEIEELSCPGSPRSPEEAKKRILDIHKSFVSIYDVALSREDLYRIAHQDNSTLPRARRTPATPDMRRLTFKPVEVTQSNESLRTKMLKRTLAGTLHFDAAEGANFSSSMPKLTC